MADRYLRASGNWNGAVWAATSGGTAGSASAPGASDVVHIKANYTVTLVADVTVQDLYQDNGTLNLSTFDLTINGTMNSYGTNARAIDFYYNGRLIFNTVYGNSTDGLHLLGSNLSILKGGKGEIVLNYTVGGTGGLLDLGSHAFDAVTINIDTTSALTLRITGNPNIDRFVINGNSNYAHKIVVDDFAMISYRGFAATGPSTTNRLRFTPLDEGDPTSAIFAGNIYGQDAVYGTNLDMDTYYDTTASPEGIAPAPAYIGTSSTSDGANWLLQNVPKADTFTDALTTAPASNANWEVVNSGTLPSLGTNGYVFAPGTRMVSTGTYDLFESSLIFEFDHDEVVAVNEFTVAIGLPDNFDGSEWSTTEAQAFNFDFFMGDISIWDMNSSGSSFTIPTGLKYIRVRANESSQTWAVDWSANGSTWTQLISEPIFKPEATIPLLKAARIYVGNASGSGSNVELYAINPTVSAPVAETGNFLPFFMP